MADLTQHAAYTGDFSGLLNNLWLTLAIGGVCLLGYEIEIRIPRRRGWEGTRKRVWVRIYLKGKEWWDLSRRRGRNHRHQEDGMPKIHDGSPSGEKEISDAQRQKLGDREAWEFG